MLIKVLAKADRILQCVAARPGLSFSELQAELDLHKATLSNILKTLTDLGYTARDAAGHCHLGPRILELAAGERRRRVLPALAEECARTLAESLRETVTIGKLLDGDRFNLAKATVDRTVSVNARLELRPSPYDTATGRVLLAYCTPAELAEVKAKHGFPGAAWDGLADAAGLTAALAAIRAAGHAELHRGDARSFAVPACGADGRLAAAIGVAVPAYRCPDEKREAVLTTLGAAAARLARALDVGAEDE
jgi:IclR family pca regulon transcriptional regulator